MLEKLSQRVLAASVEVVLSPVLSLSQEASGPDNAATSS